MANVKRKPGNAGSAVIEAALVLPVLILVTFGTIEYGWLFLKSQQIGNAARNASRMGII